MTVRVCETLSCQMAGADGAARRARRRCADRDVRVIGAPCIGRCEHAPAAVVGRNAIDQATAERSRAAIAARAHRGRAAPRTSTTPPIARDGGYQTLLECVNGNRDVESVLADDGGFGLRGLGGAGFPTGRKWRIVRAEPAPRLMAVNIDEGEPGTFKDRYYLERDPHRFLEGMLIAAWAVGIDAIYIYLRDEYACVPRDARARDRGADGRSAVRRCRRSTCAAAPAPTSAAKSRR